MKTILATFCLLISAINASAQKPEAEASNKEQRPLTPAAANAQAQEQALDQTPEVVDEAYEILANMSPQDYMGIRLPPLHVLLENARNAPQASFYQMNRDIQERELKTIRRTWLRNIKLNANYSYGMGNVYNQSTTDTGDPFAVLSGQRQNLWNVGASFSLPLDEVFNRRNKVRQQKQRIEQTSFELERWYDDLRLTIIDSYTAAIESLSTLQSAAESMAAAKAQYTISETNFVNGQIDAIELSSQKNIEYQSVREYQMVRRNLNKALLQLEVLSNTIILSQNMIGVSNNDN